MRVLVLESDPHVSQSVVSELQAAGHTVLRCHEPELPAFPCRALLDPGSCPLDDPAGTDVVLDHRAHVHVRPTPYEDGVACAVRRHLPLVASGLSMFSPFDPWTTRLVGDEGVVAACEAAAAAPVQSLALPAQQCVEDLLAIAGASSDGVEVDVRRRGPNVQAVVTLPNASGEMDGAAAVKVAGVLRATDRHAAKIDVTVQRSGP